MAYDKTTDMQTLTVSAAFAQCQANFVSIKDEALSLDGVKTLTSSPIVPTPTTDMQAATKKYVDDAFKALYPIGALYISTVATNPNTLLGFGTWVAFGEGKVMVGINSADTDFDVAEETGGEKTHTLTIAEVPAHTHDVETHAGGVGTSYVNGADSGAGVATNISGAAITKGGGGAHNNLQPYIVCYFFKRVS